MSNPFQDSRKPGLSQCLRAKRVVREYARMFKRLSVESFLCFSSFSIDFGQCVNEIIGDKESGKSSVQRAIFAALGVENSSTLNQLVKAGCKQGKVELVLNNVGENSFDYGSYGKEIIIQRCFDDSELTSLQLKSENGDVLSTKEEDLQQMLIFFKMKTHLISIINRGNIGIFLGMSPEEKYSIFLQVTNLEFEMPTLPELMETCTLDDSRTMHHCLSQEKRQSSEDRNSLKLIDIKTKTLEKAFCKVLLVRNLSGKLNVDHVKRQIKVTAFSPDVAAKCADGKTLSDEDNMNSLLDETKSFFAVALLLAIWKVADQPTLSIDDFELFMGSKVASGDRLSEFEAFIKLIFDMACEKPKCQFVLSLPAGTPQAEPSAKCSLIRLTSHKKAPVGENHSKNSLDNDGLFLKEVQHYEKMSFRQPGQELKQESLLTTPKRLFSPPEGCQPENLPRMLFSQPNEDFKATLLQTPNVMLQRQTSHSRGNRDYKTQTKSVFSCSNQGLEDGVLSQIQFLCPRGGDEPRTATKRPFSQPKESFEHGALSKRPFVKVQRSFQEITRRRSVSQPGSNFGHGNPPQRQFLRPQEGFRHKAAQKRQFLKSRGGYGRIFASRGLLSRPQRGYGIGFPFQRPFLQPRGVPANDCLVRTNMQSYRQRSYIPQNLRFNGPLI